MAPIYQCIQHPVLPFLTSLCAPVFIKPLPDVPYILAPARSIHTLFKTLAMPVCPRSVSCHPMGSMSFKALQAQPLPHCRSHERSLSKEAASSKTVRRRTAGTTTVGRVIRLEPVGLIIKAAAIYTFVLYMTLLASMLSRLLSAFMVCSQYLLKNILLVFLPVTACVTAYSI